MRTDRLTGKPRGFGFVTFESAVSASASIKHMHGYSHQGRPLTVRQATNRGETEDDKEMLIKDVVASSSTKSWGQWVGPVAPRGKAKQNHVIETAVDPESDPKGDLQKILLSKARLSSTGEIVRYSVRRASETSFVCELSIRLPQDTDDRTYQSDVCSSKKAAEKSAATKALESFVSERSISAAQEIGRMDGVVACASP